MTDGLDLESRYRRLLAATADLRTEVEGLATSGNSGLARLARRAADRFDQALRPKAPPPAPVIRFTPKLVVDNSSAIVDSVVSTHGDHDDRFPH